MVVAEMCVGGNADDCLCPACVLIFSRMEPSVIIAFLCVVLGILGIVAALRSPASPPMPEVAQKYCPSCGAVGVPQFRQSGSASVAVLLWLFFLAPGIIYSIWRASTKRWVCPKCEQPGVIPLDSPKARDALGDPAQTIRQIVERKRTS
jgi:hypothetical protein